MVTEWLISELKLCHFLQFSILPIVYLGLFIFLGIQDLEETENDRRLRRWSLTAKVLKYGLIPVLLIVFLSNYYSINKPSLALALTSISFMACVFYAAASFEGLLILARLKRLTFESADLKLIVAVGLFGLYYSPQQLGLSIGMSDVEGKYSRLPIVETLYPSEKELRLLFISGDNAFTLQPRVCQSEMSKIVLLNVSKIKTIYKQKNIKGVWFFCNFEDCVARK